MESCTNCGADASFRCTGCLDAPEYRGGDDVGVFYCSHECQKSNWPSHKKSCNNMRRRKSLLRAVKLLKTTLLSYREVNYEYDLVKIEPRARDLILKHDPTRMHLNKPAHFPNHLTSNVEHKEAALLKHTAVTSLSVLGPMTRTLLKGLVSRLEFVLIDIKNPPYPVKMNPPTAGLLDVMNTSPHLFVLATLKGLGEKWVIDITGCQFGFKGALFPLDKYITEKHCTLVTPIRPYNHTETQDLDGIIATMGRLQPVPMSYMTKIAGYRRHFAALVKEHVDSSLIEGSDAEFEAKMNDFSAKVKEHISSYQN